jgi:hypothetical protein
MSYKNVLFLSELRRPNVIVPLKPCPLPEAVDNYPATTPPVVRASLSLPLPPPPPPPPAAKNRKRRSEEAMPSDDSSDR